MALSQSVLGPPRLPTLGGRFPRQPQNTTWIISTMKAALRDRFGDNDRVRVAEVPQPTPRGNDLLVRVKAASINPVVLKIRSGKLKPLMPYRLPLVLGNDLSGVVVEVGPGVTKFKVGDPIFARLDQDRIGALAELVLVREPSAAQKPARLSHVEAASLPLVRLTAWQCLLDIGHLKPGQRVLVSGRIQSRQARRRRRDRRWKSRRQVRPQLGYESSFCPGARLHVASHRPRRERGRSPFVAVCCLVYCP